VGGESLLVVEMIEHLARESANPRLDPVVP
jgi:hypothetical protein